MLKRRTPLRPRTDWVPPPSAPLRVTEAFRLGQPVGDAVVAVPKFVYFRSLSYRMWVASLPCLVCRIETYSNCCHSNQKKHGHDGAIKASDQYSFPLCCLRGLNHHFEHDQCIGMTKAERDELEDRYIAETWELARAAGRPEVAQWEAV